MGKWWYILSTDNGNSYSVTGIYTGLLSLDALCFLPSLGLELYTETKKEEILLGSIILYREHLNVSLCHYVGELLRMG